MAGMAQHGAFPGASGSGARRAPSNIVALGDLPPTRVKRFLEQFDLHDQDAPVSLACDNQAAINLAYNPEHHKRVKHIERRHFFIREKVEENMIEVPYVRTVDNLADFFTKPLLGDVFIRMRDQIMNCGTCAPPSTRRIARGG